MVAASNSAMTFVDCEDDVCINVGPGYVCANHTQVPDPDKGPGNNCDVGPGGGSCDEEPCSGGDEDPIVD